LKIKVLLYVGLYRTSLPLSVYSSSNNLTTDSLACSHYSQFRQGRQMQRKSRNSSLLWHLVGQTREGQVKQWRRHCRKGVQGKCPCRNC